MSRLNKANEIIELAILMQNSYCGLTIDDIAEHFECCRRSAQRMKAVLYEHFGNKIEEVINLTDKKKRWRFKKGTMNWLISFSSTDFALILESEINPKSRISTVLLFPSILIFLIVISCKGIFKLWQSTLPSNLPTFVFTSL